MTWLRARLPGGLKLAPVREHQGRRAQKLELHRIVLGQFVTHRRNDGGIEAFVVQGHFVLLRRHIAVHDAARDFGEQLGHAP